MRSDKVAQLATAKGIAETRDEAVGQKIKACINAQADPNTTEAQWVTLCTDLGAAADAKNELADWIAVHSPSLNNNMLDWTDPPGSGGG